MSWTRRSVRRDHAFVQLLDDLRREHELIDRLLETLRTFAADFAGGRAPVEDGFAILDCLHAYAGDWHHEREEGVLFPALARFVRTDRGPIAVLLSDHHVMSDSLREMRAALAAHAAHPFKHLAHDYTRALWAHIDAENSVLFPEGEIQLRRNGIRELATREMPAAIIAVAKRAEELMARYPRGDAADVIRGEGCVMCPVYGDTCAGIEREWWNEWEWEELDEHVAGA